MHKEEFDPQELLKSSEVFQLLPPETFRTLLNASRIERYEHRTLLVRQGQRQEHLRYIVNGHIHLTMSTADGKSTGLPIYSGGWATWAGCFSEKTMALEAWSSKSAVFVAFPCRLVRAEVTKYPEALVRVIEHIIDTNRFLLTWVLNERVHSPEKRLAFMLMALLRTTLERREQAVITQEEIGRLGFGSRQRVARLLRSLELQGLIEMRYGGVKVASWETLKAFISKKDRDDVMLS
jgi:hypothetical protein